MKSGDYTLNSRLALDTALKVDANLRVLFYAGDTDLGCNFLGVKAVAAQVQYESQAEFQAKIAKSEKSFEKMKVGTSGRGDSYGNFVQAGRFTYARVYGAGHMINENKPVESKDMIEKWIRGASFKVSVQEESPDGLTEEVEEL